MAHDPENIKANFRMSQATFALSRGKSDVQRLTTALKFARKASESSNDSAVLAHLEVVEKTHAELALKKQANIGNVEDVDEEPTKLP